MLTRKDFERIAGIIRRYSYLDNYGVPAVFQEDIVRELADYFADENPRFDVAKFIAACAREDNS